MKKTPFLSCAAYLFAAHSGYSLDLTPHFVTRVTGAESASIPYFTEGDTRYSLEMPPSVSASANESGAVFYFREIEGSLTLRSSPFKPDAPFSGEALEAYRKAALGWVPAGATDIALKRETPNPFPFNGWISQRFTMAYQLPGRSFLLSVTFLNFSAQQQILLITSAPMNQFERAEALTLNLVKAWRKLRPGESIAVPPPL